VLGGAGAVASGIRPILSSGPLILQALFLIVLGTFGTYVFQTWAQGRMSATHAAIIYTLEPVVTALLAARFLGERLGARGGAGGRGCWRGSSCRRSGCGGETSPPHPDPLPRRGRGSRREAAPSRGGTSTCTRTSRGRSARPCCPC